MKIYTPKYYSQFRCLAGACPDSCCQEWTVDVDPDTAAFYRSLSGSLGDRLRSVLQDTGDGVIMAIENRRCPMWQQDGLCRIQAELGHDALCKTCRDFPRLRHDYGNFVELGLELSCPEAARLIFSCNSAALNQESVSEKGLSEYDAELMEILLRSRSAALSFLDGSNMTLSQTLAAILLYSHAVQSEIDGGEPAVFDPNRYLQQARSFPLPVGNISSFTEFFASLEILTPRWQNLLANLQGGTVIDERLRPLARYIIQRYWLQAISDFDLLCRVKFLIIACLLISYLGGDPIQTSQLFSKEIENNPDNVETILDAAYTCPAFTDLHLLSMLLMP